MQKVRVGILGGSGYTAIELIKILLRHPHVEITAVTSRQEGNPPVSELHPSLYNRIQLRCEDLKPAQLSARCDLVFCCLPHGASMAAIPELLSAGTRVIDLSADYRLHDPEVYREWYQHEHTDPGRLATTVYGLPELFRKQIPGQQLIANPGCYTSTSILALAPALAEDWIDGQSIIIDAKSGVSGAGRTAKQNLLYCETNEAFSAYSVGNHRHTPEIEQALREFSGREVQVLFTPHLVPMDRGILATIYATPRTDRPQSDWLAMFRSFYNSSPFVRVLDGLPNTKSVAHTNFFDLTIRLVRGRVVLLAAIDNLIKGASGVAVQNFNLLYGFPETSGFSEWNAA